MFLQVPVFPQLVSFRYWNETAACKTRFISSTADTRIVPSPQHFDPRVLKPIQVFPVFAGLLSRRPVSKSHFIVQASSLLQRPGCSRVHYFLLPPSPTRYSTKLATHHDLMNSLLSRRERSATIAAFTESLVSVGGLRTRRSMCRIWLLLVSTSLMSQTKCGYVKVYC